MPGSSQAKRDPIIQSYEEMLSSHQPVSLIDATSFSEEVRRNCGARLSLMLKTFDIACPRDFTNETIRFFEDHYLDHIHLQLSDEIKWPTVEEASMSIKYIFNVLQDEFINFEKSKNNKTHIYRALKECVQAFEVALQCLYLPEHTASPGLGKKLIDSKQIMLDMYTYLSKSSFSKIATPSIQDFEKQIRTEIISSILDSTDSDVGPYITDKSAFLSKIRDIKMYFNLSIDILEIEQKSRLKDQQKRLREYLVQLEKDLRAMKTLWII